MKKLQLLISEPCSMQWDDMQPNSQGRYCGRCEKNIVDLTGKTDSELIRFLKQKKDNVCGRLLPAQLERDLVVPQTRTSWQWLLPLAIGAVFVSPAQAEALRPVAMVEAMQGSTPTFSLHEATTERAILTVAGRVTDQEGKPVRGVKIKQKGFGNVLAVTDSAGRFRLDIDKAGLDKVYVFEHVDFSPVEMPVKDGMVVKLPELDIILGKIAVVPVSDARLYIVYAGKESCIIDEARYTQIPAAWIEKSEVFGGAQAAALYGSRAANGAVVINIKKAYAKNFNFSKKNN